ncbi:MAG TPA: Clp protease N-terminal domain-containing protein, partial [Smithellaceae bacterium]|nr:Clp protease N-terminal domain-containing protein [Smithellaceae bacterium]
MRFDKFTLKVQEAIQDAQSQAEALGHQALEPEHLLAALLKQENGIAGAILKKMGVSPEQTGQELAEYLKRQPHVEGAAGQAYLSPRANKLLDKALTEAARLKDEYVSAEHVLIAASEEKDGKAGSILRQAGVTKDKIFQALVEVRGNQRVTDPNPEGKYQALQRYAKDFNELARKGSFDPVIGRDEEIRRIMQVLSRRTKNNPVLIGEPGVGKTAIVEGLAQRIVAMDIDAERRVPSGNVVRTGGESHARRVVALHALVGQDLVEGEPPADADIGLPGSEPGRRDQHGRRV